MPEDCNSFRNWGIRSGKRAVKSGCYVATIFRDCAHMRGSANSNMCACAGQIFVATWQGSYDITNDEERTDNCSNLTNFSPGNGAAQVMLESSV